MRFSTFTNKSRAPIAAALAALSFIVLSQACARRTAEAQYIERGKRLVEKKDYARALLEFRNASRVAPASGEPFYQAALVYLSQGDYRRAYFSLVRATEVDPKHAAAQTKLAEVIESGAASTRDPQALQEAEQRIQSALAIIPDNPDALGALGVTEYMLGKPEDATKHLEAALAKLPQHLASARALAVIKLNQKDLAGAEEVLKNLVQQSPKSPEALVVLARFYQVTHRIPDAEASYRRALVVDPKHGPALLDLARLQTAAGHKEEAEHTLATLSALPDKQYRPLHAMFLFDQGRQDEALKEFAQQAAADPKDREAFQRLATAYFFAKRFSDVENLVNSALKSNPKNVDALLERSRLYLVTSRFNEAGADLEQVVRYKPDSAMAHYLLSKVYQAKGQRRPRQSQLDEALRLDSNLLIARLESAEAFNSAGAAKSAISVLNQTPEVQKDLLPVIVARNWALLAVDDRPSLRAGIDHGLSRYPSSPDLLLQDAMLRIKNHDYAGGRKTLERVLAATPQDLQAIDAMGKSYLLQKQPAAAMQAVVHYTSPYPNSAPLQGLLGQWLAGNGRFDDARKAFQAAITADPSYMTARVNAAYLEVADGKFDAARRAFASIPASPTTIVMCELGLAQIEERTGNPSGAIPHYRKVLDADPNNIPALNGLAYQLANETGQIDEALKYAQQAMELAPSIFVEDTIGWAYYRKGLYRSAVQHLENAVAKNTMAVPKYHLAMAYMKSGDTQKGRLLLQQARGANPNLPEAIAAQKLLLEVSSQNN